MKNIWSNELYTAETYLELITNNSYIKPQEVEDDVLWIHDILENVEKYDPGALWDYPLDEIDHIIENDLQVVLVDCLVLNKQTGEYEHELNWFEVDFYDEEED